MLVLHACMLLALVRIVPIVDLRRMCEEAHTLHECMMRMPSVHCSLHARFATANACMLCTELSALALHCEKLVSPEPSHSPGARSVPCADSCHTLPMPANRISSAPPPGPMPPRLLVVSLSAENSSFVDSRTQSAGSGGSKSIGTLEGEVVGSRLGTIVGKPLGASDGESVGEADGGECRWQ